MICNLWYMNNFDSASDTKCNKYSLPQKISLQKFKHRRVIIALKKDITWKYNIYVSCFLEKLHEVSYFMSSNLLGQTKTTIWRVWSPILEVEKKSLKGHSHSFESINIKWATYTYSSSGTFHAWQDIFNQALQNSNTEPTFCSDVQNISQTDTASYLNNQESLQPYFGEHS